MRRSLAVALIVVAAFGLLTAPVVQAADINNVDASDVQMESVTETTNIQVTNDGDNSTTADVSIDSTPSGVTVTHDGNEELEPGQTTDVELEIDVDDTADSGTVSGDVNGEPFEFEVTPPPLVGFDDEPLDLGDVLVGETDDGDVNIEELTGENSLDGVEWTVVSDDPDADLSFSNMATVTGSAGAATWNVDVDDNVDQYESLSWTVEAHDTNYPDATREIDVEARVIYPGYFGDLDLEDDRFVFDEPRDENDELTQRLDLSVENAGDQPLDVSSISADTSNSDISVQVVNEPDTIASTSTRTVELSVTADTDLSEDEYDIDVDASADDFDVDDASLSGEFELVHATELTADDISFGDVPIGQSQSVTTTVSEELGYTDLTDLTIEQSDGPDDWISTQSTLSSLDASDSETLDFGLEFDTSAELGTEYEWTYTVDGERDTEEVTVRATPVPLDFDPIRDDISEHDGEIADDTLVLVDTMDDQLRDGELDDDDISAVLAFGDASTMYLSAVDEANAHLENDDHEATQQELERAAAALNTMNLYSQDISEPQLHTDSQDVVASGEADVEGLVDQQAAHYQQQLDEGELTLIEEATIKRQLSRTATLQGDTERGEELGSESSEAFDTYVETISSAEEDVQNAESAWSAMDSEQFVTVLGQPLLFNPAEYDTFSERTEEMETSYDSAIDSFEEAGATSRAETVAEERDERASETSVATGSLLISTGIFGIVSITIIGRTARQMYWYVQDSRETVSGDFLL